MKRLIFGAAGVAVVALACGTASADHGYRGHDGPHGDISLHFHQHYHSGNSYRGGYSRSYTPSYQPRSFGSYGRRGYGSYGNSFSEAARQVREAHSRYRFNTHPRSYYNTPRYHYRLGGW